MTTPFTAYLKRSPLTIMTVDPSVNYTGVSIVKQWVDSFQPLPRPAYVFADSMVRCRILDYQLITTSPELEHLCQAVRSMAESARCFAEQYQPGLVLIEQPPMTMYNQQASKPALIARAQSVFQTFSVAYGIYGSLYRNFNCRIILPIHWQLHKKRRGGAEIKDWSLYYANDGISKFCDLAASERFKAYLHTKKDENVADAITIALRTFDQFHSGGLDFNEYLR